MGKRSTARRLAMQVMYQYDIQKTDYEQIVAYTIEDANYIQDTKIFARQLSDITFTNLEQIDALIVKKSRDWSFDRLAKIDKSILRVALSEMKTAETPLSVIINEAIEMARKYSGDDSVKFINGILGNIKPEDLQ